MSTTAEAAEQVAESSELSVVRVEYLHTAFLGPVVDHKGITHIDIWIKLSAYKKILESGKSWSAEKTAFTDDTPPSTRAEQLKNLDQLWPIMEEWGKCWTEFAEHLKHDIYPSLNDSQRKTYIDTFSSRADDEHKLAQLDRLLQANPTGGGSQQALRSLISCYELCLSANFALGLLFCSFLAGQYMTFESLLKALSSNLSCFRESLEKLVHRYLMPYLGGGAKSSEASSDADLLAWMLPFDYFIYARYESKKDPSNPPEAEKRVLFEPSRLRSQRSNEDRANFTEAPFDPNTDSPPIDRDVSCGGTELEEFVAGNRFSWVPAEWKEEREHKARDIWEQLGPGWESKEPEGLRRRAPHNRSGSVDGEYSVSEPVTGLNSARQQRQRNPSTDVDSAQATSPSPSVPGRPKQSLKPGFGDIGHFFRQAPCLIFVPMMAIVVVASAITGICYTAVNNDASGGFTLAAWILGVGAFVLTPLYAKHLNGCECLRWLTRQKSDHPGDRSV